MKTEIRITGQNNGNFKLRNAIVTHECEEKKFFNDIILVFPTKGKAVKALSKGYRSLCADMPDEKGKMSGIGYLRGHALSYDASRAAIATN